MLDSLSSNLPVELLASSFFLLRDTEPSIKLAFNATPESSAFNTVNVECIRPGARPTVLS